LKIVHSGRFCFIPFKCDGALHSAAYELSLTACANSVIAWVGLHITG